MTCDRCEEAARQGCRFCPGCGEPLDSCTLCAEYARQGYEYCGRCGRHLVDAEGEEKKDDHIVEKTVFIAVPCITALLIVEALSMLWWSGETFGWLAARSFDVFLLLPQMVTVGTISGGALQAFWVFLVIAILASCLFLAYQSRTVIDRKAPRYIERIKTAPVYWVALMFGAYLVLSIVISALEGALGYHIVTPEGLPTGTGPQSIFSYAEAAVWEEIVSRMIPIGIPMVVVAGLCGRKDCLKYLLGGFGMTRVALVLMVISAVIFGMAHEGSWGAWKILPTIVAGLMMSYLYIRFGIHASIVFHFLMDYSMIASEVIGHELFSFIFILVAITGFVAVYGLFKYMWEGASNIGSMPVWIRDQRPEESSDSSLD